MLGMSISPNVGEGAPMGYSIGGVRWGVSKFLRVVHTKPLHICYDLAAVLNLIFLTTHFWGRSTPRSSTMVVLGRTMVCSHRLSVQTTVVSDTVWLQYVMQVLTGVCEPKFGGGEMDALSSSVVTS